MQLKAKDDPEVPRLSAYADEVKPPITPERRLLTAMLSFAVSDAMTRTDEHGTSARQWIREKPEGDAPPWSFHWVCDHLDLCPHRMRKALTSERPRYKHRARR